jgi:hypothetical protein
VKKRKVLTAEDPMPFGQFKGTPMGKLPLTYLDFLLRQVWLKEWPHVEAYVSSRKSEVEAARPKVETPKFLTTFDDYLKWGRK